MKTFRYFVVTTFVLLFAVFSVSAQTNPLAKPAPATVAFINVPKFGDSKAGIKRYVAAADALDREFEVRDRELKAIADKAAALENELKGGATMKPDVYQAKRDEYERLKREFTFKQEEGKALYQKRQNELLGPVTEHILKELDAFAKANGIKVVLDVSKLAELIVVYSADADITNAFIADYNAKNPVTTTPATTTPVKRP